MRQDYGALTFARGRVQGNAATRGDGGGFLLWYLTATISDVMFKSNTAVQKGGAVFLLGQSSVGAVSMTAIRCSFHENEQTDSTTTLSHNGGGAVFADRNSTVVVRESTFFKNKAANGHGHQLMTRKDSTNVPSITLINTDFVHCDTWNLTVLARKAWTKHNW